jgi:hypothetical protein
MLFDLTFPCYLTTFSGKKCLSGKVICAIFWPAYRSSPVNLCQMEVDAKLSCLRLLGEEPGGLRSCGGGLEAREDIEKDCETTSVTFNAFP